MSAGLALVVCTYRRPAETSRLLDAVAGQTRVPDETLVVDASPDGATRAAVGRRRDLHGLTCLAVPERERGLTRQRNLGIDHTRSAVVAFLDDDAIPAKDYFAELMACLARHPDAAGAGGRITNEVRWHRADGSGPAGLRCFRIDGWERREDARWVLRKWLRLEPETPPGVMPPSGHGRSVGFLPPDGRDHEVEFLMGGASAWRREVFSRARFSTRYSGYGLYEDLDFCLDARRAGPLYLCNRAQLEHHHAAKGRPPGFDYGRMVVVNGHRVWRKRWPAPPAAARCRWWATTLLLTGCRFGAALRGPARVRALAEAAGRLWGAGQTLLDRREARP